MNFHGFISLVLFIRICWAFQLSARFPPNITWVNALDTPDQLHAYLSSEHRMARQGISLDAVDGDTLLMGQNRNFTMLACIQMFLRVETTHFLLFHVHQGLVFRRAYQLLKNFNNRRLGVLANIEKGPNCRNCSHGAMPGHYSYVPRNVVYQLLLVWPTQVRLVFGYVTGTDGPINQYSKWQMRFLYDTLSVFGQVYYSLPYVIEFDAYLLGNKFNLLENVERIKMHRWLVVIHAPTMSYAVDVDALRRMIYFLGPKSVYLNVPDEMRRLIGANEWNDNTGTMSGGMQEERLVLMIPLSVVLIVVIKDI